MSKPFPSEMKPRNFIVDVDGCLNTGQFLYSSKGKIFKIFGADDADALEILKKKIYIHLVSGDKRGFPITKKRVIDDMKLPLDLVSTFERVKWLKRKFDLTETIYMGDGIYDALVFEKVAYSIAPNNAFYTTKQKANFVTETKGGEGAVAEACLHIMEKFFEPFDLLKLNIKSSGVWRN